MQKKIAQQLLALNHQFYQSFADDFSATRERLQPGVLRVLDEISPESRILDLGCGNGYLAKHLAETGFEGSYLGADFSPALLGKAAALVPAGFPAEFIELDLASPDWEAGLLGEKFEAVLCFAALHHLPGLEIRQAACAGLARVTKPGGRAYLSNWQFLRSERLRQRIQPWEVVGLDESQIDQGDYLMDWRRGGTALRYLHHFSLDELEELAVESGFQVVNSFFSDGKEGDLSLYQVWELS